MTTREDDAEIIRAVRKLLIGLRRTGISLAVLAVVAGVSAYLDIDTWSPIVTGVTTGLITGRGLIMIIGAGHLIKEIDSAAMEALLDPRRGGR